MRIFLIAFILLLGAAPAARAVEAAALERGTAITDPATLRELDGGRFRLDRMLLPERSADAPLSNDELFRLAVDDAGPAGDRWRVRALCCQAQS